MPKTVPESTLHIALELSNTSWKIGFQGGEKRRFRTVPARDTDKLVEEIVLAKQKLRLPEGARVVSCYEAGRDGFWLHRWLLARGIENVVVDPASMKVDRRARRRKTDNLDVKAILADLVRFARGESGVWSVVRVPDCDNEDRQRLSRERSRLVKERTAHSNRIRSLLILHGLDSKSADDAVSNLDSLRRWDGTPVGRYACIELRREHKRWKLAHEQINEIECEQRQSLRCERRKPDGEPTDPYLSMANMLIDLKGVGLTSAWMLAHEFFWREFFNRREVGAAAGLTGTPFQSGDTSKELGISKAGNRRIRALMIELAWSWVRFQPDSVITKWFQRRFATGSRARKIGIVAVARRLLIALWHWLRDGVLPEGAILQTSVAVA